MRTILTLLLLGCAGPRAVAINNAPPPKSKLYCVAANPEASLSNFTADDRFATVCVDRKSENAEPSCSRLELASGSWEASLPVAPIAKATIASPVELRSEDTEFTRRTGAEPAIRACRGETCTVLDTKGGRGVVSRDGRRAVLIEGDFWYPSGTSLFDTTTGKNLGRFGELNVAGNVTLTSLGDLVYMAGVVFDWARV